MASLALVEYPDFKTDFKHHIFVDSSKLLEDLLGELPTPPLSPDHAEGADRSHLTDTTQEDLDVGESILQQMMASSDDVPFNSQSSYGSDSSEDILNIDPNVLLAGNPQALLLQDQDCMWSCNSYEPRHSIGCNGVYTPAPSPPPQGKEAAMEEEEEEEQVFEVSKCKKLEGEECISPNEVLVLMTAKAAEEEELIEEEITMDREPRKPVLSYRRVMSSGNARLHPQATASSESGELLVCMLAMLWHWCNPEGSHSQWITKWCKLTDQTCLSPIVLP